MVKLLDHLIHLILVWRASALDHTLLSLKCSTTQVFQSQFCHSNNFLGQHNPTGLPEMMEIFKYTLSNMVATSHMWLMSTRNEAGGLRSWILKFIQFSRVNLNSHSPDLACLRLSSWIWKMASIKYILVVAWGSNVTMHRKPQALCPAWRQGL